MRILRVFIAMLAIAAVAKAEVKTKTIEYKDGDVVLEGYLAWDDAVKEPRPGVLIVHAWMGHNPYVRKRAEQLAAAGYVAFALDMYGKGVLLTDPKEAGKYAGSFKGDRPKMRKRAQAGLDVLRAQPGVDTSNVAAIGYCFGGTTVLELARSGADLKAVVSFHGGLDAPMPAEKGKIKAHILVCHGADDPHVSADEVKGFEEEMRKAGVDWQLVKYGGAVHSFTEVEAGNDASKGAAYNEAADRRSWAAMSSFFNEVLK